MAFALTDMADSLGFILGPLIGAIKALFIGAIKALLIGPVKAPVSLLIDR
jgi:hypothetical protein